MKISTPVKLAPAIAIGACLCLLFSATAFAGKFGRSGRGPMAMLAGLNLTDEQKTAVKAVFQSHSDEMSLARSNMRQAKDAFRVVSTADPFNETSVREAFAQMVPYLEELAVLRARIFSEIRPILTAEQLEALNTKMENKRRRLVAP